MEQFCSLLVDFSLSPTDPHRLSITAEERNHILGAWNRVGEQDKQPQTFSQLYKSHWGNMLYCRTKRDDLAEASLVQHVKLARRYIPAQHYVSAEHNRLMYMLVKMLWLRVPSRGHLPEPEKGAITKAYSRIQQLVLVDDPVLSKVGIPLPKINSKTVRDFIHRQERLANYHSTKTPSCMMPWPC